NRSEALQAPLDLRDQLTILAKQDEERLQAGILERRAVGRSVRPFLSHDELSLDEALQWSSDRAHGETRLAGELSSAKAFVVFRFDVQALDQLSFGLADEQRLEHLVFHTSCPDSHLGGALCLRFENTCLHFRDTCLQI